MSQFTLNLFYDEPDPDRFVPFDRYPRRVVRRVLRGKPQPGGMKRWFLNLCEGLDRIGQPYRVNDYRHARRNPSEPVGIVGKPFMVDVREWKNPIVYGPAVPSHPLDDPALFQRRPITRLLLSCDWMRDMYATTYPADRLAVWPSGVDTYTWAPDAGRERDVDVLVYDKIRWEHERYEKELLEPLHARLAARGLRVETLRYGSYREADYHALTKRAKAMVFLCEHETQGFAYLQALSAGVPLLAWDRGGEWRDPEFYPERVRFAPVTSVPYWDDRCGVRFAGAQDLPARLDEFLDGVAAARFAPRDYVTETLSLERCAREYAQHLQSLA